MNLKHLNGVPHLYIECTVLCCTVNNIQRHFPPTTPSHERDNDKKHF